MNPMPDEHAATDPSAQAAGTAPRRRWPSRLRDLLPDLAAFTGALVCAALAAVLSVGLGGCGGGVGTEGTGSFSLGTISGFGSIVVNGVHYDESTATVQDDDAQALDRGRLRLGMVVEVEAGPVSTDASGRVNATASRVRTLRALQGPVAALDAAAGTLTVLDQPVRVAADTVIDTAAGGTLAALRVGRVVEVYGFYDGSRGSWVASRIGDASDDRLRITGTVQSVDAASRSVVVNGRSYSLAALGGSLPAAGTTLRLEVGSNRDGEGRLLARSAREDSSGRPPEQAAARLEGVVTRLPGAGRLQVDGTTVDIAAARIDGTLAAGARVEVTGTWRSGLLVAERVTVRAADGDRRFEVEGSIGSIDVAARRFVLRGVTVSYARGDVEFRDGASAAALATWRGQVRVEGVLSADRSVLEATRIGFRP